MINPEGLAYGVSFNGDFPVDALSYNKQLGFLEVSEEDIAFGAIRLVGFASSPVPSTKPLVGESILKPVTELSELPATQWKIDLQGKGVGPRMYNFPEALAGSKVKPDKIGVYSFDLELDRLLDARVTQGNKIQRIARHASRILKSKTISLERTVDAIHASYGDVDAVELEMPPLPELRQLRHGVSNPEGVTPQFIIVRNPSITLGRVGTAHVRW